MTSTPRTNRVLLMPDPRAPRGPRGPHAANVRRFRLARIRLLEPARRPSLAPRQARA